MGAKTSQSDRSSPMKRRHATARLTRINIRSAGGSPSQRGVRTQPGGLNPGNMFETVCPESGARLVGPKRIVRFTPAALEPGAPAGHVALERPTPGLNPRAESSSPFGGRIKSFPLATRTAVRGQRKRKTTTSTKIFESRSTLIET
jgi:hypothetical protein